MRDDLHQPYVPFVMGVLSDDILRVRCPRCDESIDCRERKDFETFTQREFVDHYNAAHNAMRVACCECGKPLDPVRTSLPVYCLDCVDP
jgi:endogenous inhibitor of DNA gyrase (YacG/DUF329 family)